MSMGMDMDDDMGGMGGGGGGGGGHPFGGFGGMGGGMNGFAQQQQQSRQPQKTPTVERQLAVSLEDLYKGTTKRVKITRDRVVNGQVQPQAKELTIDIKPGWKAGTKITFEGESDERPGQSPGDIKFVITEKPHARFTRKGDDLEHKRSVTLTQALTGVKFGIEALDGSTVTVDCSNVIIYPGYEKIFTGKGMSNSKTGKYGALVVKFDVVFPTKPLTDQQKDLIKQANLDRNM